MVQPRMLMTLAIAGLIVWWPLTFAQAQTAADVFQVSRISVDATAADAVAAREQALLQGQIEGLHRLLRRLAPTAEHGRLPAVGAAEIQRYVQNFEISDEQVASNRYLAHLTVRYDPDAVRTLLQGEGLSYAETVSEPLVVLPVYQVPGGPRLWPEDNPWWQAWADNLDPERLLRLVLPLGDLEDMPTARSPVTRRRWRRWQGATAPLTCSWSSPRRGAALLRRLKARRRARRLCSSSMYAAAASRAIRPRRWKGRRARRSKASWPRR